MATPAPSDVNVTPAAGTTQVNTPVTVTACDLPGASSWTLSINSAPSTPFHLAHARLDTAAVIGPDGSGGARIYVAGGWGSCSISTGLMNCTESVGINAAGDTLSASSVPGLNLITARMRHGLTVSDLAQIASTFPTTLTLGAWSNTSQALPGGAVTGRFGLAIESAYFYAVAGTTDETDALKTVYQIVY